MTDVNEPLITRKRQINDDQPSFGRFREQEDDEGDGLITDYGSGVYRYPTYLQPGHFTSLEKLLFFLSSILLILLFVFVGLYARSSQVDNDPFVPVPRKPENNTKTPSYCLDSNCVVTAADILENVDRELDPCDDFYSYVCSKWQEAHVIPDVKSRIDTQSTTTNLIRHRLDHILNRNFNELYKQQKPTIPSPDHILDRQLFTKLSDFYHSCMNQDMIEKANIKPLYPLFRTIREYISLSQDQVNPKGLNQALSFLADRNIWALFEMKIEPDMIYNPTKPSLSLWQGQVGLPYRELYDDPETMSVYMQVVTSILDLVFKQDTSNEFGWKSWSTIATARRIVEFEKKLAQATLIADYPQPERWSMNRLEQEAPSIQWAQFIQQHLPDVSAPPSYILIPSPKFIDNLSKDVLSTTNTRTLQMYFIWRTIWKYLDTLGEQFVAPKRKLDAKLSGVVPRALPERRDVCIDMIDKSALGILMGRYYLVDQQERISQSKPKIQQVIQNVTKTLIDRVPHLDWIAKEDDQTRDTIIRKLQTIDVQVGFSTSRPNLTSVISLSEYFGDISINQTDFFANMIESNQHQVRQTWRLLGKPIDRNAWKKNAHSVEIEYEVKQNKLIVPAGLLQLPYFDPDSPSYLYAGTIGSMVGHEIMHAFDTQGRNYNDKGIYGQWWSNQTIHHLDQQNQCLIDQYESFGLDGKRTLDNNYADYGGLKLLESKIHQFEDISIPGLDRYWTQDQLGYIQFARLRCSKSTKEYESLIKQSAPDRYRVNGPLMSSDNFAATFECKKGSFMNPTDDQIKKCQVW
ncbi:hypothetical protein BD560DRAFT_400554 [Blakeslea trispora]|nr:hypothetical protein BD560DRAFT_400554 [Blakeslea trispora]